MSNFFIYLPSSNNNNRNNENINNNNTNNRILNNSNENVSNISNVSRILVNESCEIIRIYEGELKYNNKNIQEIININDLELKSFEISPNYFFPTIGQTNPKFDRDDVAKFYNNDMIKIVYDEMIVKYVLKCGYMINNDFSFSKYNQFYEYNINIIVI